MAPYKYRGGLNICFQLSITIGIFIANLFNYYFAHILDGQGWRLSLGLGAVPAVIFVVGSICLPDSPNSLVERDRLEEARKELQKLRGTTEVDAELNDIVAASEASKKVAHPWRTLRERKYRPQLIFAICIPFFQQFTGLNVITFYAPILFRSIGFGSTASLMSAVIIGSFKPISTLISILVVDKFGRRSLFLEGGAQMLICQVQPIIVSYFFWHHYIYAKYLSTDNRSSSLGNLLPPLEKSSFIISFFLFMGLEMKIIFI